MSEKYQDPEELNDESEEINEESDTSSFVDSNEVFDLPSKIVEELRKNKPLQ